MASDSTTIRRPFHWGIVVVADAEGSQPYPEVEPTQPVTADQNAVIVTVRHAQDVELASGDQKIPLAEVEVQVLLHTEEVPAQDDRRELYRGTLELPSGRVYVGDADEQVEFTAPDGRAEIVVTVGPEVDESDLSPDAVQIDISTRA